MLRRAAGLVPGSEEYYNHAASKQLQLESSMERDADARRRLLAVLDEDFEGLVDCKPSDIRDGDPNPRPCKRRALPWSDSQSNLGGMPIDPRAEALREATQSSVTQWPGERRDVPPIQEADRARYQKWLESSNFPAASDPKIWEAIRTNWISFLSATGSMPNRELAPCRKVVTWGPREWESQQAMIQRFKQDRKTRRCIQQAVWLQFDGLEALAERWPVPIRTIVNQAGLGTEKVPFESWGAKIDLTKRRRGNSILAALVCFLVYSHDEGTLEGMGLEPSEELLESIMDVTEAVGRHGRTSRSRARNPGPVEEAVADLVTELITDPTATFRTNPLLWWVGVLVQSAVQTDRDDYISRGRFDLNILTMDMDIQERLEALLHYSKVFVLDYSMNSWETSASKVDEVHASMAAVDLEWLHVDDNQRPAASADKRTCQSAAWKDLVKHVRAKSKAFLGGRPTTVAGQLRVLLLQG